VSTGGPEQQTLLQISCVDAHPSSTLSKLMAGQHPSTVCSSCIRDRSSSAQHPFSHPPSDIASSPHSAFGPSQHPSTFCPSQRSSEISSRHPPCFANTVDGLQSSLAILSSFGTGVAVRPHVLMGASGVPEQQILVCFSVVEGLAAPHMSKRSPAMLSSVA